MFQIPALLLLVWGGKKLFSRLIIVLSVTTIILFWKMFNCCDELFSYAKSQWPCRCKMTCMRVRHICTNFIVWLVVGILFFYEVPR